MEKETAMWRVLFRHSMRSTGGFFNGYYKNGIALVRHSNVVDSYFRQFSAELQKKIGNFQLWKWTEKVLRVCLGGNVKNERPCGDVIKNTAYAVRAHTPT